MNPLALHVITLARKADRKDLLLEALEAEGLAYEVHGNDVLVPEARLRCQFQWSGIYYTHLTEDVLSHA